MPVPTDGDADPKEAVLLSMARSLHGAGQPSHRLERTLLLAARQLGVPVQVLVLPTTIFIQISGHSQILRLRSGGVHLEQLGALTAVARGLIRGSLPVNEAQTRVADIVAAPRRWGRLATAMAHVLSAAAFAVIFGGGWTELLVAVCVGLAVGLFADALHGERAAGRMFELTAAAAAAVIVGLADSLIGAVVDWIPLASGLIMLLPGIGLVDSVEELASGHLLSGGARLAGVGVVFLAITFGTVLGSTLGAGFPHGPPVHQTVSLGDWAIVPALAVLAVGSTIRFRARPGDFISVLTASAVALVASRAGVTFAGPLTGPFLAAVALGAGANIYARFSNQAAECFAIPGLALLVPGSVGLRSLDALLSQDTTVGIDAAFHMFMIAVALASGLLFTNALLEDNAIQDS